MPTDTLLYTLGIAKVFFPRRFGQLSLFCFLVLFYSVLEDYLKSQIFFCLLQQLFNQFSSMNSKMYP